MLKIRIFRPNTGSECGYLTSSGANGKISYIILLLCGFFPCCLAHMLRVPIFRIKREWI